jgi:hypothetical protein
LQATSGKSERDTFIALTLQSDLSTTTDGTDNANALPFEIAHVLCGRLDVIFPDFREWKPGLTTRLQSTRRLDRRRVLSFS